MIMPVLDAHCRSKLSSAAVSIHLLHEHGVVMRPSDHIARSAVSHELGLISQHLQLVHHTGVCEINTSHAVLSADVPLRGLPLFECHASMN